MTEHEILWAGIFAWGALLILLIYNIPRFREHKAIDQNKPEPEFEFDLGHPGNRLRLETMLKEYGVVGSAHIRDGKVRPALTGDETRVLATKLILLPDIWDTEYHKVRPDLLATVQQEPNGGWRQILADVSVADIQSAGHMLSELIAERRDATSGLSKGVGSEASNN